MRYERNHTRRSIVVALTLTLAAVMSLVASYGEAFVIRKTTAGEPVRWNAVQIDILLDPSLSSLGPKQEVEETIINAFENWGDSADLPIFFQFSRGSCVGIENANCISANNYDWPSDDGAGATTKLSYNEPSGDIIDADILFNLDAGTWSNDGEPGTLNIGAAALHEVGHLLGLEHSEVEDARMAPKLGLYEGDEATLHEDDIRGITEAYATWGGFLLTTGCTAVPGAPSRAPISLLALAALLFSL
jgi:Matrixin